ncbi:hypothetical protein GA0070612_5736 [Micromonospora chokoriensis]|uniref:Uncharacterized protein n=1 Tax=Micromonospora chokoriensis TaxID=356851 RepID=A0A1C4Z3K5_9ACTN|nr:hypothetical protein GA0070612_5736 [Micromonospora chokoriensis]
MHFVWGCHHGAVEHEAFYSTTAQVLPTIMIALAVEANLLLQRQRKDLEDAHGALASEYEQAKMRAEAERERQHPTSRGTSGSTVGAGRASVGIPSLPAPFYEHHKRLYEQQKKIFSNHQAALERQRNVAIVTGLVFLIGEIAAVSALLLGPGTVIPVESRLTVGQLCVPFAGFAIVALSISVIVLPVLRFPKHDDLTAPYWRLSQSASFSGAKFAPPGRASVGRDLVPAPEKPGGGPP